jgi:hypothetical protein
MDSTFAKPDLAYFLIGYEPHDQNARQLEELLASLNAKRVSSCEWVLKAERGSTLELYRTIGSCDVRGFFAQQLSDGFDWHKIAYQADDLLSHLKIS